MSVTKIQIPADQIEVVRRSLLITRGELETVLAEGHDRGLLAPGPQMRLDELDHLLGQIEPGITLAPDVPTANSRELTGSRGALWSAVYDAVCRAAERIAEDCGEYWLGVIDPAETRTLITELGIGFELLCSLGPPPGDDGGWR